MVTMALYSGCMRTDKILLKVERPGNIQHKCRLMPNAELRVTSMEIYKTIIVGVSIFVIGQIVVKLFIDPVQEFRRSIAKVRLEIVRTSHILHNTDIHDRDKIDKVFNDYRSLSGELLAGLEVIPAYSFVCFVFLLPSRKRIMAASTNLIALSNWMMVGHDRKIGHIIKNDSELIDNLGFSVPKSQRLDKDLIKQLIDSEA